MRIRLAILLSATAILWSSCIVYVDRPVAVHQQESWVEIESNTDWQGEIDGLNIRGHGDRTIYTDAECATVENLTSRGYIRVTIVRHGWDEATSYSNTAYGSVWVCN